MVYMSDWVEDESMSREETLARFRALGPERTVGPRDPAPLPGGARIITVIRSFNTAVTVPARRVDAPAQFGGGSQPQTAAAITTQ